jgi:hypothetical protein
MRFIQNATLACVRSGGAKDPAEAERRDDSGDPANRRLRVSGSAADGGRESCPTKLLLANPAMDFSPYAEMLQFERNVTGWRI